MDDQERRNFIISLRMATDEYCQKVVNYRVEEQVHARHVQDLAVVEANITLDVARETDANGKSVYSNEATRKAAILFRLSMTKEYSDESDSRWAVKTAQAEYEVARARMQTERAIASLLAPQPE